MEDRAGSSHRLHRIPTSHPLDMLLVLGVGAAARRTNSVDVRTRVCQGRATERAVCLPKTGPRRWWS